MTFEHEPPSDGEDPHGAGTELLWGESWYFDFAALDGSVGGYVRIGHYPNLGAVWYWATLVGPDRPTVIFVDHEVRPTKGPLDLSTTDLVARHHIEAPYRRAAVSLEAQARALDDPVDAYRGRTGVSAPLAFELEWLTDGDVHFWGPGLDRYEIPCSVRGRIEVGDETIDFAGRGQRDHSWGVRDWWANGWCWAAFGLDDGRRVQLVTMAGFEWSFGYIQSPGEAARAITTAAVSYTPGPEGIPTDISIDVDGSTFLIQPLAWSPVQLSHPESGSDQEARFPRALIRVSVPGDGRSASGTGWIEFNQPPSAAPYR